MGHCGANAEVGPAGAVRTTRSRADGPGAHAGRYALGGIELILLAYAATLGPLLGGACRFSPSCSEYARQAIARHGWRGLWLALRRLLRCHPLGGYGWDPVPESDEVGR